MNSSLRRRASAVAPLAFLSALLFFQNCADSRLNSASSSSESDGVLGAVNVGASKLECRFIGPDVLRDRIQNALGVSAGDVSALDDSGRATSTMRLASQLETLGKADVAAGRLEDASCGTVKFKAAIEIMVDACAVAMSNPANRARLFPSGTNDFGPIFLALTGRRPTLFEAEQVSKAAQGANAEAKACAVVASSFESLIRI